MARIRSVHPALFTDEAWVSCSPLARILFIGLWTDADDQGVFEWKPLQIKMRLLPGDTADARSLLAELSEVGLIKQYEHDGATLGAIKNFRKYQRPKKPNAVHVLPAELEEYVGLDDGDDADNLRKILCDQQGGRCFYCATEITHYSKRHNSLDIDHRVPRSQGGSDDEDNLVAACRACNRGKCDRSEAEWRAILASRVAKSAVANAKGELAPQMEDGGWRGGEKEEPIGSSSSAIVVSLVPAPSPAEQVPKKPKASRLPDDWTPSHTDRAFAEAEGLSPEEIDRAAAEFRDYWRARSRDAARADWPATWRNRVRQIADRRRGVAGASSPGGNGPRATSFAGIVAKRRGLASGVV